MFLLMMSSETRMKDIHTVATMQSSQSQEDMAYCIWRRAGNARLVALPQGPCITHLLLLWDHGRSKAGRVHQGCGGKTCSKGQGMVAVGAKACSESTGELLCKVRLSTSSWHLAYDVAGKSQAWMHQQVVTRTIAKSCTISPAPPAAAVDHQQMR
jgi:hypothetical protein